MKVLAIIFLIFAIASFALYVFKMIKVLKDHIVGQSKYQIVGSKKYLLMLLAFLTGVFLSQSAIFYVLGRGIEASVFELFLMGTGAAIFGAAFSLATGAFILYYYKLDLEEKQKHFFSLFWPICLILSIFGLYLYTTGIAEYITYPLISGISFSSGAIRGGEAGSGFKIKFYGILIVSGALLCYAITEHMVYQKYKKHGLIDTLFIVAFLAGILGARLWYCLVLEPKYFLANPSQILLGIGQGGLAIQGGALLGIATGVAFVLIFRRYMDVRFVADVAVPTILLAQCIGRWGNFFNQEVYGAATSMQSLWYLPKIIKYNMFIDGSYRVPLFFIEGTMNVAGYFFIRYFLGRVCKFRLGLGYQTGSYIVWYGLTRVILELFRDPEFRYLQSWYIAFAFIGVGLLLILGFYALHKFRMKKGLEDQCGEKI